MLFNEKQSNLFLFAISVLLILVFFELLFSNGDIQLRQKLASSGISKLQLGKYFDKIELFLLILIIIHFNSLNNIKKVYILSLCTITYYLYFAKKEVRIFIRTSNTNRIIFYVRHLCLFFFSCKLFCLLFFFIFLLKFLCILGKNAGKNNKANQVRY